MLPSMGWHFIYHARHFFYMMGRDDDMIRFSIPHLVKANGYDPELVSEAINETNRNVKFIKAVRLDCGSVSLDCKHLILFKVKIKKVFYFAAMNQKIYDYITRHPQRTPLRYLFTYRYRLCTHRQHYG